MTNLSRLMARGAAWLLLMKLTDRGMGLISIVILARLLVPGDFGLVAMAHAIIAMLALLGAFSFDVALIQNPNAEPRHFDTVWTFGVLFAAFYAIALLALAYPAATFYNEPRLAAVMGVLAASTLIAAFENIGMVKFRKELQFNWEFKFMFVKRCTTFVVTVTLAFYWRDYWALVAGTFAGSITAVLLSYLWHPYRPRFSLAAAPELFRFSRWLFLSNTLGFLYHRSADFILGKAIGTTGLGQYAVAYEIANLPSAEMAMPINRAVFSGYAKMAADITALRQGFLTVLSLLMVLVIPAAAGLACVAEPIVIIFLGDQWTGTIPLIQVLALNGLLTAIMNCCIYAYLALGKPRYTTLIMGTHVAISIPLVTYAAFTWGIVSVAWMILIASVLIVPLNYYLLSLSLKVTSSDLARILWRPVVGAATMAAVVLQVSPLLNFGPALSARIASLLLVVGTGAVTYCGCVALLWMLVRFPAGAERYIWTQVVERLKSMR